MIQAIGKNERIDFFVLLDGVEAFCKCAVAASAGGNAECVQYVGGLYVTDTVPIAIRVFDYLSVDLLEFSQELIKAINPELKISYEYKVLLPDTSLFSATGYCVTSKIIEDKRAAKLLVAPYLELSAPRRLPEGIAETCANSALRKVGHGPFRRYLGFSEEDLGSEVKNRLIGLLQSDGLEQDKDFELAAETDGSHYTFVWLSSRERISSSFLVRIRRLAAEIQPWTVVFYLETKGVDDTVELFTVFGSGIKSGKDPAVNKMIGLFN